MSKEFVLVTPNGFEVPEAALRRAWARTPPAAKLETLEMVAPGRAMIGYRFPGLRRSTHLEIEV